MALALRRTAAKGEWKQANRARRGSEAWRISLSDVSNYVYVSAPPSRAIPLVPVSDYTAMSGAPFAAKRCTCRARVLRRRAPKPEIRE